jgi:D-arabinan exo alpha-(1,3)/(1,5)-arabinofuranosidase (non-reducing end)
MRHRRLSLVILTLLALGASLFGMQAKEETYAPMSAFVRQFAGIQDARTARISSWDQTGGNKDCVTVDPGEDKVLAEIKGPGSIRHIFVGTTTPARTFLRELVLRMYWDGEKEPSVEVPLGDFFLTGHEAYVRHLSSTFVVINPGTSGLGSHGYNSYFPMPFGNGARITLENQTDRKSAQFCYQIEYESYHQPLASDVGRFHAQWRRENPTRSTAAAANKNKVLWEGANKDGQCNYVILEAEGKGHLLGFLLNIDNAQEGWYGEGDDMIFIDGETWPPRYHGTGTEEIFGGGACPNHEYAGPYSGFHMTENKGGKNFAGKVSLFRWFVHDPVRFQKSIRWTIEHGHANNFENDYSSVAYWYQLEPHAPFPRLPAPQERLSLMPEEYFKARTLLFSTQDQLGKLDRLSSDVKERLRNIRRDGHRLFQEGQFARALEKFEYHAREARKLSAWN